MPTTFPTSNDVFNVPSTPATTPLGSPGSSDRKHSESHRDFGDALMAMQSEATLKAHTHDGSTFRHGSKLAQANTHQSPDTDIATTSLHHTIGTGANQYASGTHTHPTVTTYPVGAFFMACVSTYPGVTDPVLNTPGLGLIGTWTAVGQRFLCASGGTLGFAAGSTGGSNSHSHSIDSTTNTAATHTHSLASNITGSGGGHTHTANGTFSASRTHFHDTASYSSTHAVYSGDESGGSPTTGHAHTSPNSSPSHSHSAPTTGSVASHTHTLPSTSLGASSTHSHTNSSPASSNNLIPLFVVWMWKRTA